MLHEEITSRIIGCAYTVYNILGSGYLESAYEKCMMIELQRESLRAESQVPIAINYKGFPVGNFIADIVVEGVIIVELKAVENIMKIHEVQLVNYLNATGKEVACS